MTTTTPITSSTFDGLAFPIAVVRYSSSGWSAKIYRDRDRIYRARTGYHHALSSGAVNARPAAIKALEKLLADSNGFPATHTPDDFVAIPGDLDADTYTFTFVEKDIINRQR